MHWEQTGICCWCLQLSCVINCFSIITKKIPQVKKKPSDWLTAIWQTKLWYTQLPILRYRAALMGLNDPLRSRLFPTRASLTFSLSVQRICAGHGMGKHQGSIAFLITGADKHHSTITPVGHGQVQRQVGLLHHQPSAAPIHLCFVHFSGRYKMTQFPLSSHLILRKLSLMWWIISSSVYWLTVERESSRHIPSQMYCILIFTGLRHWV